MKLPYLTKEALHHFISNAIKEDVGDGDHSSLASVPATAKKEAKLIVKGEGIIAGIEMARLIFEQVDNSLFLDFILEDGKKVNHGDIGFIVRGNAQSILTGERLVLNCLQRMSGIATYTHELQSMINHTQCRLLDTRKTTPNFRIAEKWAVAIGGGTNHRFGLYDMIMLKDNHIDFAGGVKQAVEHTKRYLNEKGLKLRIEVETRSIEEVEEVLAAKGVDVIMLDNMANDEMREAVKLINGICQVEASGGITEDTIVEKAETGVDFISVGALTHSYKSLDISLKAV